VKALLAAALLLAAAPGFGGDGQWQGGSVRVQGGGQASGQGSGQGDGKGGGSKQQETPGVFRSSRADDDSAQKDGGSGESEGAKEPAGESAAAAPMDLNDAKVNFDAVVRGFLSRNSEDGSWAALDADTGKTVGLTLKSLDLDTVTPGKEPGRYTGKALMADAKGKELTVRFEVDFSGSDWTVSGHELLRARARPKRKGKKR
jgi:hypothetical protein